MMRICSIPGCGRKHSGRGYCSAHLNRMKRYGDPLGGRQTMEGEPMRFYREVVLKHDGDECLPWPYTKDSKGYGQLRCDGVHKMVHRLVCEVVNGPAPSPTHEAAHLCGKGHEACCAKRHLSWKTRAENESDKLAHGTHSRGDRHGSAKLNRDQVQEIRSLRGVEPQCSIAVRYGVSPSTVSDIQTRRKWAWLAAPASPVGEER